MKYFYNIRTVGIVYIFTHFYIYFYIYTGYSASLFTGTPYENQTVINKTHHAYT